MGIQTFRYRSMRAARTVYCSGSSCIRSQLNGALVLPRHPRVLLTKVGFEKAGERVLDTKYRFWRVKFIWLKEPPIVSSLTKQTGHPARRPGYSIFALPTAILAPAPLPV